MAKQRSFRDPENCAHFFEGSWYRIASDESAHAMLALLEAPAFSTLRDRGLIVGFERANAEESKAVLDSYNDGAWRAMAAGASVFRVADNELITYPWEWPNALLASAALATLDTRDLLLDAQLDLKDASAFNVQFRGVCPTFIDLGSIAAWRPNPGWNASRQFVEHFINPLAVGASPSMSSAEAWLLSRGRGVRSEQARDLMSSRLRRRVGLALLQAMTRPVAGNRPSETRYQDTAESNRDLAIKATRSLNRRLAKHTRALNTTKHQSTWSDYGSRDHYQEAELQTKLQFAADFIAGDPKRSGRVLDVGGNDGLTAQHLVRTHGASVVVLDADVGALDALCGAIADDTALARSITPVWGDVTNLSPSSGLLGAEFASFTERVRPTAVVCQAVVHHIVITQGVPMGGAVQTLAMFGAPVHIEFATEDDPKVQLLLSQIPNWSGEYSTAALMRELEQRFERVTIVGPTSPTRIAVTAESPR